MLESAEASEVPASAFCNMKIKQECHPLKNELERPLTAHILYLALSMESSNYNVSIISVEAR